MPLLSQWFIKIGMGYFVAGMLLGMAMLLQPVLNWSPGIQALRPVYLHFLFIGWVTQIIIGVSYWMFPKQSKERPRGSEPLGWAVLILLNIGLILRAVGEPAMLLAPQAGLGWMLGIASICLLAAGWGYIFNTWGRVKER